MVLYDNVTFSRLFRLIDVQILEAMCFCKIDWRETLIYRWPILYTDAWCRESKFDLLNCFNARIIHSEKQSIPRTLLAIRDSRTPVIAPLINKMITYLYPAVTFKALHLDQLPDYLLKILIVLIDLPSDLSVIVTIYSLIRGACDCVMVGHQRKQAKHVKRMWE